MYKPSQRRVEVELLASAGWLTGTIHVPERSSLLAFMNKAAEFMPVTTTGAGNERGDFLALRRGAIVLAIPQPEDIDDHASLQPGTYDPCRVRCLFPEACVEGTIQVLCGQRMSDFLETNPNFFLLSECTLVAEDGVPQSIPHVIVNGRHLLAVTDLTKREHGRITSLLETVGAER